MIDDQKLIEEYKHNYKEPILVSDPKQPEKITLMKIALIFGLIVAIGAYLFGTEFLKNQEATNQKLDTMIKLVGGK